MTPSPKRKGKIETEKDKAYQALVEAVRAHLASVDGRNGWLGGLNKRLRIALADVEKLMPSKNIAAGKPRGNEKA
jgi:hypothetical protein